jgi:thiamine-phosphate pyrophosphorylase
MRSDSPFPALYPILDFACVFPEGAPDALARWSRLAALAGSLAAAGVALLQYRNKLDSDRLVAEDCLAVREAAPRMTLILNDRPALVAPARFDGVHIGQDDLSPAEARALVGPQAIVGFSTHTDDQVRHADLQPVDYIAIGPVFSTATKADTSPVVGLEGVARSRALTAKPLVAIGGITLENAASVYGAGADSLAVISGIFALGRDPARTAQEFLRIVQGPRSFPF